MQIIKILSLLGCFCSVYLFFMSEEVILIMFGSQWHNAIMPFKLLSVSIWMQLLTNTIGPIYQSLGDTKTMFRSTLITTLVIISCIIFGILLGKIDYVALMVTIAYVINFFITFFIMVKKEFQTGYWDFLSRFSHELIIVLLLVFCGFLSHKIEGSLLSTFVWKSLLFFVTYIIGLYITKSHIIILRLFKR